MLQQIEIWNYRSIRHAAVSLQRFMVLVGPNGAGKTNFVTALDLLGRIVQRATIRPLLEQGYDAVILREKKPARAGLWFTFRVHVPGSVVARTVLQSYGKNVRVRGAFAVEVEGTLGFSGSITASSVSIAKEVLQVRGPDGAITISVAAGGEVDVSTDGKAQMVSKLVASSLVGHRLLREAKSGPLRVVREFYAGQGISDPAQLKIINWQRLNAPWMRHVRDSLRVKVLRPEAGVLREESLYASAAADADLGSRGDHLAAAVAKLRGLTTKPRPGFLPILNALRAINPDLEDIWVDSVPPGRLILKFKERGIAQALTSDAVSDGVLHALALLIGIENRGSQPGILAIEEPENAIHPWALRVLLKRAEAKAAAAAQIILTTHSATLVNAVEKPESLFIVDKSDGKTAIVPATEKDHVLRSVLQESGQELGEVWLGGSLGGVPSEPQ